MAKLSLDDFFAHDHYYKRRDGLIYEHTDHTVLIAIRYYLESRNHHQCECLREYARTWQPKSYSHQIIRKLVLGEIKIEHLLNPRKRGWQQRKLTPAQINSSVRWICKRLDQWLLVPYPAPRKLPNASSAPSKGIVIPPIPTRE